VIELTNEDVADVLALLDSLPYDELDVQTPRFRLILRRTPDGWTQSMESRVAPTVLSAGAPGPVAAAAEPVSAAAEPVAAAAGSVSAAAEPVAAAPMEHRCRYSDTDVPSVSQGLGTDGTDGADGELVAVRAPLPGTFYRAPRPGAAPFVEVGSRVGADTVVGIIETMKLMNSVTAGAAGTVAEICLGNAEFAAHGSALLRIRAD
jgi:acetyl-CoA carboxylase biotin carboxyl carrier protein